MPETLRALLVVEDDAALRETIHDVLMEAGFRVMSAADGVEAVELLTQGVRPCVILCDADMPRLGGADLVRHVRNSPELAGVRVVLMSGSVQRQDELDCDFLRKPLDLPQLIQLATAHNC